MQISELRTLPGACAAWTRTVIEWWALAGGTVLVILVLLDVYSLVAGALFGTPLPGGFEFVEMGVAVAAFAFLPYCQLTGSHVSADIFMSRAGSGTRAACKLLAAMVALFVAAILTWRMAAGLDAYREFEEVTAIMGIRIWYAFVPILISLVLLNAAAVLTLLEALATTRPVLHDDRKGL